MTNEPAGVVPQPKMDSRYYREGATWEEDRTRWERSKMSLAWIVATVMSVIALGAIFALASMVPLKSYEPYMIVVDKSSGFVEVKRPMAEGSLTQDELVTMFNVVRYVKARETYDPKALKDNFDLAQLLSTGAASRDLTELFSPGNPRNPVKEFGATSEISVNVKSVTFPNQRTALVRFSTRRKIRVERRASRLGVAGALPLFGRPDGQPDALRQSARISGDRISARSGNGALAQ